MPPIKKQKLDLLVTELGLARDQKEAQGLILAGMVLVNGQVSDKPGMSFKRTDQVELRQSDKYVGRGALKLAAAFQSFAITVKDKVCVDVGSSTGGFTQVLLEQGASKVYAVDVAYGELHWKLRQDPKVVVMERTSITTLENLPEAVHFISIDVSLLPLKSILPILAKWKPNNFDIVALVKPQYEANREQLPVGAIIKDPKLHEAILNDFRQWCGEHCFLLVDLVAAPILGMGGNQEFLALIRVQPNS